MAKTTKKSAPVAPPAPAKPLPPFVEGMFFAIKQLEEVLWERRQGMHRLERAVRSAPESEQQSISDVLEPLGGGVMDNVLGTVKRRLESRLMEEAQRRMDADREREG